MGKVLSKVPSKVPYDKTPQSITPDTKYWRRNTNRNIHIAGPPEGSPNRVSIRVLYCKHIVNIVEKEKRKKEEEPKTPFEYH